MGQTALNDFLTTENGFDDGPDVACCPTCGDKFDSRRGLKAHHRQAHNEKLGPPVSADWLREQYQTQGRTTTEIADELGCHHGTVARWLDRQGISRRDPAQYNATGDIEPLRDAEWLRNQYHEQGLNLREIADELGVHRSTVGKWMKRHGIEARTISEIQTEGELERLKNSVWLEKQYRELERTTHDIARELEVSHGAVLNWMEKHGIDSRTSGESQADGSTELLRDVDWLRKQYHDLARSSNEIADDCGVSKKTVLNWLRRHGIPRRESGVKLEEDAELLRDGDWLREQYHELEHSTIEIAETCGVSKKTVLNRMREHGIERRDPGRTGNSASMYAAVRKFLSGGSWGQISKIHRKQNPNCQLCGSDENTHAHHIVPIMVGGTNAEWNLMTLCETCHHAAEWYTREFTEPVLIDSVA